EASRLADEVYDALDGWNDEPRAINALARKDPDMRWRISAQFRQAQDGLDIREYLKDQLSGWWLVEAYTYLKSDRDVDPHTAMARALASPPFQTREDEVFRILYGSTLAGRQV